MAFPTDPLDVTVGLAFGADPAADPASFTFTDVTADNRARVVIRRGRQNEGGDRLEPGRCVLRFGNDGGTYTPYNPSSIRWPNIRPDTPIQVMAASSVRATQFVADWRPGFADGGGGPWEGAPICDVEAGGVLRRLGQGTPQALSPVRRAVMSPEHTELLAYWPLEDAAHSQQAASAIAGQPAMTVSGSVDFAAVDLQTFSPPFRIGSQPVPDLNGGGSLRGTVPTGVSSPVEWSVQFAAGANTIPTSSHVLAEWTTTGGTYARWTVQQITGAGTTDVVVYDSAGTPTTILSAPGWVTGTELHRVDAKQNGANVDVRLWYFRAYQDTATLAGVTLGRVTSVTANPTSAFHSDSIGIGHVMVWDDYDAPGFDRAFVGSFPATDDPWWSYYGERFDTRLARLCAQEGITLTMPAVSADFAVQMGAQPAGTFLDLLRECADADQGVLYEPRTGELGYLPREWLYNRPVDLAAQKAHLTPGFHPTADDQTIRNDVTVTRSLGSSARYTDDAHIAAHGHHKHSITINVASDGVLFDHAAWRVGLGTVEELRYPKITLNLHADPDLIPAWLACDIGSRITIANAPASMPPGLIDLIIDGYIETLDALEWTVDLTCSPARPWEVWQVEGDRLGRVGADSATFVAAIAASALSAQVAVSPLASTDAAQYPVDLDIDGEQVRVSAVDRSFVDTFGRVASNGWDSPWVVNAGLTSVYSVNGSAGLIAVSAVNAEHHITYDVGTTTQDMRIWATLPVVPTGAAINWGLLLRYLDGSNHLWIDAQVGTDSSITLRLIKRLLGATTVLGTFPTGVAHSTTVPRALRADIIDDRLRARLWSTDATEQIDWPAFVIDATGLPQGTRAGVIARLMTGNTNTTPVTIQFDNVATANPQAFTFSDRALNGVSKAHVAGTPVRLWRPGRLAL